MEPQEEEEEKTEKNKKRKGGGGGEEEEKKIHEGCTAWLKLLFPIRKPTLGI